MGLTLATQFDRIWRHEPSGDIYEVATEFDPEVEIYLDRAIERVRLVFSDESVLHYGGPPERLH